MKAGAICLTLAEYRQFLVLVQRHVYAYSPKSFHLSVDSRHALVLSESHSQLGIVKCCERKESRRGFQQSLQIYLHSVEWRPSE